MICFAPYYPIYSSFHIFYINSLTHPLLRSLDSLVTSIDTLFHSINWDSLSDSFNLGGVSWPGDSVITYLLNGPDALSHSLDLTHSVTHWTWLTNSPNGLDSPTHSIDLTYSVTQWTWLTHSNSTNWDSLSDSFNLGGVSWPGDSVITYLLNGPDALSHSLDLTHSVTHWTWLTNSPNGLDSPTHSIDLTYSVTQWTWLTHSNSTNWDSLSDSFDLGGVSWPGDSVVVALTHPLSRWTWLTQSLSGLDSPTLTQRTGTHSVTLRSRGSILTCWLSDRGIGSLTHSLYLTHRLTQWTWLSQSLLQYRRSIFTWWLSDRGIDSLTHSVDLTHPLTQWTCLPHALSGLYSLSHCLNWLLSRRSILTLWRSGEWLAALKSRLKRSLTVSMRSVTKQVSFEISFFFSKELRLV